jgi:glycosyltransferase involved in cell wall biosynthesis
MKICFLTPEYPHPKTGTSGGIGTSILNLSKGLYLLGHQVSIVVYGQDKDEVFHENDITFYKVKNVKFKGLSFFLTQKKVEKLLNRLVDENKIELVEAPDWTGFTAFVKPKCPLIIRQNGSDTYFCHLDQRPVKWINKFLEKRALNRCNGIISVSEFTGNLTKELFDLKSNFTVIPNAIDVAQFEAIPSINNTETILYFGTLIRKKGLLELPFIFNEVIKKNPKARLILVGKDASDITTKNNSTWQLMIPLFDKKAFENVSYLGSVPYSEIKKIIQEATVCVFPTFAEALPVSWLEAMALEKPIVASNIGWAIEVIDDGINGFLVHPKNHEKFANKMVDLMNTIELQNSFGKAARIKVLSNFSIDVVAAKSTAFYKNYL